MCHVNSQVMIKIMNVGLNHVYTLRGSHELTIGSLPLNDLLINGDTRL